jgi:cytochrome c peroxidase
MTRRLAVRLALAAVVVAAAVGVTLTAGGGTGRAGEVRLDHGGTASRAELRRVLNAVPAAGAARTRAELEAEGEELFGSSAVAKTGESCVSCHIVGGGVNPALGVITHRLQGSGSPTPDNFTGVRDAPSLWDVARTAPYNWVGSNRTLEDQVTSAITTHFKDEAAGVTAARVAAIAAYLRTLRAPTTRHDQGRLTATERHGEEIFVGKAGCVACHGGPQFTDNQIHDTGVPQVNVAQLGPGNDPGSSTVPGGFNTPQLRDVRNTAPYMHNGALKTLADVVDFYNSNPLTGGPLRLTPAERAALVAYLETL